MANLVEVKVPDIGDFKDVAVIEVMVQARRGRSPSTPASIMVESDKASMEIPSIARRRSKEIKVKLGDKVSEGSVIARRSRPQAASRRRHRAPAPGGAAARAASRAAPVASARGRQLRRQGRHRVRHARARRRPRRLLGRVPQRRPRHEDRARRALPDARRRVPERRLHPAQGAAAHRRGDGRGEALPDHGIRYGAPEIDLDKLRAFKDGVVKKLTGGLAGMAKARKVEVLTGVGGFLDPHHLEVVAADGGKKVVQLRQGHHRGRHRRR